MRYRAKLIGAGGRVLGRLHQAEHPTVSGAGGRREYEQRHPSVCIVTN